MAELVTVECSLPGASYTLFESGPTLDLHLAGPTIRGGTGAILCGFDRFAPGIGFSVGGGVRSPGIVHNVCESCHSQTGPHTIHGTNADLFLKDAA